MKAQRLFDETTDLRRIICLYTLVAAITGDQTDGATCRDSSPSLCINSRCGQPGIAEHCRRTCGLCNVTDCAVGMYRTGDSCTECQRQTQDDHDECTRTCPVTGRWGEACNKRCGVGCRSLVCYQWSGECVHGCIGGKYGQRCDLACDHCGVCGDGVSNCAREDGSCICGCSGNFYGVKCDKHCNSKCLNTSCNGTTGACTHGCIEGRFGWQCDTACSATCLHRTCYQNGSCMTCVQGYHGEQCRERCSRNCGSETCSRDGRCSPCKPGYFKTHCQEKCSDNCLNETCSQNTGKCDYGCVSGWHGDTCSVKCPENCATDKCNRDNGSCSDGCVAGAYGQHCTLTCSSNCTDMECSTTDTGRSKPVCTLGCQAGLWGEYCDKECPDHCSVCNRSTGSCLEFSVSYDSYVQSLHRLVVVLSACLGVLILVIAVMIVRRRECTSCPGFHGGISPINPDSRPEEISLHEFNVSRNSENSQYDVIRDINNDVAVEERDYEQLQAPRPDTGYMPLLATTIHVRQYQHLQTMMAQRLFDETTDLRRIICLYTLVAAITGDQADGATCRDSSPSLCIKSRCGQPGIAEHCRRTCGRCNVTECAVGMYRTGDSCTECQRKTQDDHDECTRTCPVTGRWGEACSKRCGVGCRSLVCYQWSGECAHGCIGGKYGQQCGLTCDLCGVCGDGVSNCAREDASCICGCSGNLYGVKCDKQCNSQCLNTLCNSTTGACTHGCIKGMFGWQCNSACSATCLHGTCYQNGSCMTCVQGYHDEQCRERCSRNCGSETCRRDGRCSPCKPGYFKTHCQEKCSDNCLNETCSQNNGKCDYGCVSGWHGDTCTVNCPENCATDKCSRDNGSCSDGCVAGAYGQHCTLSCSSNCTDMECSTTDTGRSKPVCTLGCEAGLWEEYCDKECPDHCSMCNRSTGSCLEFSSSQRTTQILGSALPCIFVIVLLVLVVFVRKRNTVKNISKRRQGFRNDSANNSTTKPLIYPSHQLTPRESTEHYEDGVSLPTDKAQKSNGNVIVHVHASRHSTLSLDEEGCGSGFDPRPCYVPDSSPSSSLWPTEVSVQGLRKYVEHMRRPGGFSTQCTDLPRGKLGSCYQAELPENTVKNRYRNVLPYDHCRVKLSPIPNIPGSDYINASYINGYGEPQDYVATQGPYEDVLRDFWRMLWEIDASKIIMLTNCVENRKAKCDKYWPDFGQPGSDYDDVHVQCVAEEELMNYTVRTFSVHREAELPRRLKQYHFTAWPDKEVPEDVGTLVDFHRLVKKEQSTGKGPAVVHCSAGIGRTGTWIALDYLIQQAKAEGVVDVFECIVRLRHQRMNVIQTTEQYVFLHEALMEALPSCHRMTSSLVDNGTGDYENVERRQQSKRNQFLDQDADVDHHDNNVLPDIP
ncbi:uncharacterized protein LOC124270894 [Haliotis rubra]|uniref:uncharacterized protein LOC124270894 n=1 Tax=Haliotis rubra TaxID=36100 RepID=UPI001EE4F6CF|nr:uncharacterized protein LOC124270894 [Haliotis rubra]